MKVGSGDRLRSSTSVLALAFTGYVLGSYLGLALRFPPATTSVLWPPNAILAAALLLTPASRWWACLAGTLAAHILVQAGTGWPPALIGSLYLTNCTEAMITAVGVRLFVKGPLSFSSLREVGAFLAFGAIVSPVLSSFADAAVVHLIRGESYWTVWRTRVFANSLSELSLVPLVVSLAPLLTTWPARRPSWRRVTEAVVLGCALLGAAIVVFGPSVFPIDIPGVPRTPTVFLLPMFLWAAVRFGALGISASLLMAALITSYSAIRGDRPFSILDPADSLVALQMYLILMAIPLFAISALFEERRQAASELARRLKFERALGRIAVAFVETRRDQFQARVDDCMEQIGSFFGADRVVMLQESEQSGEIESVHRWLRPGTSLPNLPCSSRDFPWGFALIAQGHTVLCGSRRELPAEAVRDRESFERLGLGSAMVAPFVFEGSLHGALSVSTALARQWRADEPAQARLFGEVMGNAVARYRIEEALHSSENLKGAILSSLSSMVAVLDRDGVIIAVNDQWLQLTAQEGRQPANVGVGVNYLDVCRNAATSGTGDAVATLNGVDDVLAGRRRSFGLEYAFSSDDSAYWYAMSVVPLLRPEGGAVITHFDVTERKLAELDSQRARQELGHFARVATVGELTASLAHQLNQPLTGILSNAQAAHRYLDTDAPNINEVRAIVTDIIEDDRRASGVIRRMRDLMTKNGAPPVAIDINALIRDVTLLLTSDSIIRNVSVRFALAPGAPHVRGDRVDLQQVILNLLVNALEAVADRPVPDRLVTVRSELNNGHIIVAVTDTGPGLPEGSEARVFEAFYTTKASGMGMGLAIARSIVESHDGRIWAAPGGNSGATFVVQLPVAKEQVP
jgi:signal transduction histidine kinase/integral membrane sensor domain MASE1